MGELVASEQITSLDLVWQINHFRSLEEGKGEIAHNDLLKIIRDEFQDEIDEGKVSHISYQDSMNRKQPMFVLTTSQAKQVLVRESKAVRKAVIHVLENIEQKVKDLLEHSETEQLKKLGHSYFRDNGALCSNLKCTAEPRKDSVDGRWVKSSATCVEVYPDQSVTSRWLL